MQHRTIRLFPIATLLFVLLALGASTDANAMTCELPVNESEAIAPEVVASEMLALSSPEAIMSLASDFAIPGTDYRTLLTPTMLTLGQPQPKQPIWLCSALGDENCHISAAGHMPDSPQPLQLRVHRLLIPSSTLALSACSATKCPPSQRSTPALHPGFSRGIYRPPRPQSFS